MKRYRVYLIVTLAVFVVSAVAIWRASRPDSDTSFSSPIRQSHRPPAQAQPERIAAVPQASRSPGIPPRQETPGEPEDLPASLSGTHVDGELRVGRDGHLVPTIGARAFFDYFLSATGEEPPDAIRARIIAAIEQRLQPNAAAEAIDLLDRYLAYRRQVLQQPAAGGDVGDLDARMAELHALRQAVLGSDAADAFFHDEELRDRVALDQHRVGTDPGLLPDEREAQLAALEEQLPESERAAREAARLPQRLAEEEAQLRSSGGTDAEIRALRESYFGAEAADRLETLDRERAAWQERVTSYLTARASIEHDESLSSEARARAVETLRGERFTPEERVRVEALDAMQATP